MIEKLSLDFVRKVYNFLTNGNDDVNFYCMCIQNQNREAATNSPIKFALNVVKINILCRLPFSKKRLFSKSIGTNYLSDLFVRPSICEVASGMLDNSHLVADIFGCAVTSIKNKSEIFNIIEEEIGIKGFAAVREKFDDPNIPIKEIYRNISNHFSTAVDCKVELSIMERYLLPNKYVIRLLDIASCNDMNITAISRTSYPRAFVEKILKRYEIHTGKLIITSEGKADIENDILESPKYTAVISCDYNGFIKKYMKTGCKPIYYRNPKFLMERAVHPDIDGDFRDIYDGICGLRLFSGLNRMSREYELSYFCIAPAITGFALKIANKADNGQKVICLCDENSVFAAILKKLTNRSDNLIFFEWSPIASSKYKSIDKWRGIIQETPIFDNAFSGVLDPLMRYQISDINDKQDSQLLARIMATAWKDKSSEGVNDAVSNLIGDLKSVVVADPIAGNSGSSDFCSILSDVKPDTIYKCFTMSNYLEDTTDNLKPLAKIVQGNKPLLWQIDNNEKKWVYPQKIDIKRLGEIYNAMRNFAQDFSEYCQRSGINTEISGKDASALYKHALTQIKEII